MTKVSINKITVLNNRIFNEIPYGTFFYCTKVEGFIPFKDPKLLLKTNDNFVYDFNSMQAMKVKESTFFSNYIQVESIEFITRAKE